MTGLDKYDPDRGTALSTVAYSWTQQAVLRSVQKSSRVVQLPIGLQVGGKQGLARFSACPGPQLVLVDSWLPWCGVCPFEHWGWSSLWQQAPLGHAAAAHAAPSSWIRLGPPVFFFFLFLSPRRRRTGSGR